MNPADLLVGALVLLVLIGAVLLYRKGRKDGDCCGSSSCTCSSCSSCPSCGSCGKQKEKRP